MQVTFHYQFDYKGIIATLVFLPHTKDGITVFRALPFPKNVISPFTLEYDCQEIAFKIVEDDVIDEIKEMEQQFSDVIESLGDLFLINTSSPFQHKHDN